MDSVSRSRRRREEGERMDAKARRARDGQTRFLRGRGTSRGAGRDALSQSPHPGLEACHLGLSSDSTNRLEDERPHAAPRYAKIVAQELEHVPGESRKLHRPRARLQNRDNRLFNGAPVARRVVGQHITKVAVGAQKRRELERKAGQSTVGGGVCGGSRHVRFRKDISHVYVTSRASAWQGMERKFLSLASLLRRLKQAFQLALRLQEIGERVSPQGREECVKRLPERLPQHAGGLDHAKAVFTEAFDDRQVLLGLTNERRKVHLGGIFREPHAASLSPDGVEIAELSEAEDDLHQVIPVDAVPFGDFVDRRQFAVLERDVGEHPEAIIAEGSEAHAKAPRTSPFKGSSTKRCKVNESRHARRGANPLVGLRKKSIRAGRFLSKG